MTRFQGRSLLLFCAVAWPLFSQKPVIAPGGLVNAATQAPVSATASRNPDYVPLVPLALYTIYGSDLASGTRIADSAPLPTTLAGASVLISTETQGSVAAPLYYVSPGQINFQMVDRTGPVTIVVRRDNGLQSDPAQARGDVAGGLGIFTLDGSGCGRAAVMNVGSDGLWTLNSPSNSASPGQPIVVLADGLGGDLHPPVGQPTPVDRLYWAYPASGLSIIEDNVTTALFAGRPLRSLFAGKAPGMIGVDQVNLLLPSDSPVGCAVPLQIYDDFFTAPLVSQRVPVSIRAGGGPCADPPLGALADLTWVKTVAAEGYDPPPPPEALRATFMSAISRREPAARPPVGVCVVRNRALPAAFRAARTCPGFEPYDGIPVNPGELTILTRATIQTPFIYKPDGSALTYTVPLPAGSIRFGGPNSVSSAGSDVMGPFFTSIVPPPAFELKTQFSAGMTLRSPIILDWTPIDEGYYVVRLSIVTHTPNLDIWNLDCATDASRGHVAFRWGPDPLLYVGPAELIVSMSSEGAQTDTFTAPGLTLGGRHGWSFEYRYNNIIAY